MQDDELRLVLRYVFDECTEDEAQRMALWIAADPARDALVRDLRRLHDAAPDAPGAGRYDITRARQTLERRRRDRSPVVALRGFRGRPRRSPVVIGAIAATIVGIVATGVTFEVMQRQHSGREYVTGAGERLSVKLDDGTQITLAPESRLRIPTGGDRAASLEGEASFRVVHDPARPFHVLANGVRVVDVGTVFDVRAYAADSVVAVAVEEGSVAVNSATPLEAGDVATVSPQGTIVRSRDVARYLAWTHGTLVFHAAPLSTVLAELNRWYGVQVSVTDRAMLTQLVTANWSTETPSAALDDLAAMLHARMVRQGRAISFTPKP